MTTKPTTLDPLAAGFLEAHPEQAARILADADPADRVALAAAAPAEVMAAVLRHLAPGDAGRIVDALPVAQARPLLAAMPAGDASRVLRGVTPAHRSQVLASLPVARAARIRLALRYPPGSVGSAMDTDAVTAGERMLVRDVVRLARRGAGALHHRIFVLSDAQRLLGAVDTRACLLHPPSTALQTLIELGSDALPARASLEAAAEHEGWERLDVLPVTDRRDTFLGVLHRAALDRLRTSAGEEKAAGDPGRAALDLAELYWESMGALLFGRRG